MSFHGALLDRYRSLDPLAQDLLDVALVLLVGWVVVRVVDRYLDGTLRRARKVDATLRAFLVRAARAAAWLIVIVVALGVWGIDAAALAGGLAVGGFVIGFAVKDVLGNLAAGVTLLLYRPFHEGETVEIAGIAGDIAELGLAMTTLKTGDGRVVTIPNGKVLGDRIINHTREPRRRADVLVGVGYGDDLDVAVQAILKAVREDPRVMAEPAPSVRFTDLGDNAVGLQVRPWVKTEDFWQAKADLHATVKRALEAAGCSIPYPQRDVHVHQVAAAGIA
ncbi:MAG: mechanosensitive ion channel family protein [Thermoplasmatota archaeon]